MEIDFSQFSLSNVLNDLTELGKSQADARTAERFAEQEQMKILEESLKTNSDFSSNQAQLFTETASTLNEMQQTAQRVQEISDNPLLRAIEPIAGFFSPEYSRDKLHQHLETQQTELNILGAQGDMLRNSTATKVNELKMQSEKIKATAAAARGVAAGDAEQLLWREKGVDTVEKAQGRAIKMAKDAELTDPKWLEKNGLVPELVKPEQELRKDRVYKEQQQIYSSRASRYQDQELTLQSATREELSNKAWQAQHGIDPMRAERQMQINDQRTLSTNNLRIQSRQIAVDDALSNMEDKDIKALASGEKRSPIISRVQADEYLKGKNDKEGARAAAAIARKQAADEAHQSALNMRINSMYTNELESAAAEAKNGIVELKDEDGSILGRVPLARIQDEMLKKTEADTRQADLAAVGQQAEDGIRARSSVLERALGISSDDSIDVHTRVQAIASNADYPMHLTPDIKTALHDLETAVDDSQLATVRDQARVRADATMRRVQDEVVKLRTAHMTGARKAATEQFYTSRTGTVRQEQALDILVPSVAAKEQTSSASYNEAIAAWNKRIQPLTAGNSRTDEGRKQTANNIQALINGKAATSEDKLRLAGIDQAVINEMNVPIFKEVLNESYAAAADQVGLPVIAAQIRAGSQNVSSPDGNFDSAVIMQKAGEELQRRGGDPRMYTEAVFNAIKPTIERVTATDGAHPEVKASLNAILYDNRPVEKLRAWVLQDYNTSMAALGRYERTEFAERFYGKATPSDLKADTRQ